MRKAIMLALLMLSVAVPVEARECDMTVEATAYSVDEDGGIDCFGRKVVAGLTLAVDPKVIPYGSKVYFYSTGEWFEARDCGGAIQGYKVDKAMSTREACFQYGRRMERIKVIFP